MKKAVLLSVMISVFTLLTESRSYAQLAAPGEAGVAMGHLHFVVRDVEAHRHFWTTLGGIPKQNGQLQLIEFPGVYVMLRKGEPAGGTYGSVINHFGLVVKNLAESLARWRAAGVKTEPNPSATQAFLVAPDDIRIEVQQDASLDTPIKMQHIHFFIGAPLEIQAWYVKHLRAKAGIRGPHNAGELPGVNLTFTAAAFNELPLPRAGTTGRSLDHIGFEVKNLEQFCKTLEAAGVKLDRPYTRLPNSNVAIAFVTDPWGTSIELTENLAPPAR